MLPDTPTQVAVARHFAKDVTLFDGPLVTRTLHTLYNPNAIELLGSDLAPLPGGGPLVAVAEGPQVSLWDVRASGRGARVARLGPGPHHGALYALAASAGGGQPLLGAAGADRGVLVYDPRKWSLLHRWASCLKYEATALHFFTASPQHAVVAGLDYEVLCAEWSSGRASRLPATSHFGSGAGPGGAAATQQRRQQHMQQQQRRQQGRAVGPQLQPEGGDDDEEGIFANAARGITFRGDAHWLGLAKVAGQDVFAGLTSSGQLYIAEFA